MNVEQSIMALERYISRCWRDNPDSTSNSLSYTEYDYLETLEELGSARLSELAIRMRVSKPTVSNMVTRLERKGLVSRSACPDDGRAINLSLSTTGKELLSQDREFFKSVIQDLLQGVDEKDQIQLASLLHQMVSRAKHKQ